MAVDTSDPSDTFLYSHNYNKPTPSGVYLLFNVKHNKGYVGSTTNFNERIGTHFKALQAGTHHNRDLQYSYDQWGANAFTVVILERCNLRSLQQTEDRWLKRFHKHNLLFNSKHTSIRPEEAIRIVQQDPHKPNLDDIGPHTW